MSEHEHDHRPPLPGFSGEPGADSRDELATWMDDWQSSGHAGEVDRATLMRRVRRRSLGLKLLTAGELLFAAAMLAFLASVALRSGHPSDLVAMGSLALLVVAAVAFSLTNRRGLWRPAAETPAAFLALARARARRRRRGLAFGALLLAAEVAIFIPWIAWRTAGAPTSRLGAYAFLTLVVALTATILWLLHRWTRRELTELAALEEALEEEPSRASTG